MADEDFFEAQTAASELKARIVEKYFATWASIVSTAALQMPEKRLAYVDLFCGPGRYGDNQKSTPLLVLERAVNDPVLRDHLVTHFNDANPEYVKRLKDEIKNIPNIKTLKYKPSISSEKIGEQTKEDYLTSRKVPSFTFIDPFGYSDLSRDLIKGVTKDWGCDCVFFFNYDGVNRGLSAGMMRPHMKAIFGRTRTNELEEALGKISGRNQAREREDLIMNTLIDAIKEVAGEYVLPFRFQRGRRTSHNIVFVTKSPKGYKVMKEIMAKESRDYDGDIASFSFSDTHRPHFKLFNVEFDKLKDDLLKRFACETLTMIEIFNKHNVGTPYLERDYKAALNDLESDGKITADPPARDRKVMKKKVTFPDKTLVRFPKRK